MIKKKILFGVIVTVTLLLFTGCCDKYTTPIDMIFKGIEKNNSRLILESSYSKSILKNARASYQEHIRLYDVPVEVMYQKLQKELGRNFKITYTVKDVENISENLREVIQKQYRIFKKDCLVKQGFKVTLLVTFKGHDNSFTKDMEIYVTDIRDVGWKLMPNTFEIISKMYLDLQNNS